MEKYAVVEPDKKQQDSKTKEASAEPKACPLCGSRLTKISAGFYCPEHGTLPFESLHK